MLGGGQKPQNHINRMDPFVERRFMTDRFSEIEKSLRSQPSLEARLKEYPELRAKIETLLSIIENAGGDVEKASQAEQRIIEEMRQMGNEVLHGWAAPAAKEGGGA